MKGLPFLSKLVHKRVRVGTSRQSLPVQNFLEFTTATTQSYLALIVFHSLKFLVTNLFLTNFYVPIFTRAC